MANVIAGLAAQLSMDTTEFRKGISEAKNSLQELKEYLPEALSIAGFLEATKAAMEFSNKIVETAKANEVAISSVLELSKALEENGGNAQNVSTIYAGFTNKIESAAQGSAKAQEAFSRIGVTLNDLRNLSEQDLFAKTVAGLANMKDSAERNGIAFQTLGKSIRGVDLVGMNQTLQESKGKFDQYAESIEMAHELSLKLEAAARQLSLSFTEAVIPSLSKLYDSLSKTSTISKFFFEILRDTAEVLAILIKDSVTLVEVFIKQIQMLGQVTSDFAHFDFKKALEDYKATQAEVTKMFEDDAKFQAEILDRTVKTNEAHKQSAISQREVVDAIGKQLGQIGELSKAYENQLSLMDQKRKEQEQLNGLSIKEKEVQDAKNKILDQEAKALDIIDQKRIAAKQLPADQQGRVNKQLDEQVAAIKKLTDEYVLGAVIRVKSTQDEQNTFAFGWDKAYKQYAENAVNYATIGQTAFTSVTNAMGSALDQFVANGKVSFSSLATSIISDLMKIWLKMQATQLLSMGLGFGKSLFGGAGGGANLSSIVNMTGGMADGGNPPVGMATLVGERGPELFIPNQSGTIIPNNQLGSLGGGSPQNVFNGPYIASMSAIDTQSATQFLASNKMAIWSANQSASRSIPASR